MKKMTIALLLMLAAWTFLITGCSQRMEKTFADSSPTQNTASALPPKGEDANSKTQNLDTATSIVYMTKKLPLKA